MIIQPKVPDAKLLEYIYDAAGKYKEIMEKPFLFTGKNRNAKYLKIGMKDKVSQYVDFSYAYGADVTLGFQKNGKGLSFPITLIPKSINTFTTKNYRILFVFTKSEKAKKYNSLYAEIKKGLFDELYCNFPQELKNLIDMRFK